MSTIPLIPTEQLQNILSELKEVIEWIYISIENWYKISDTGLECISEYGSSFLMTI